MPPASAGLGPTLHPDRGLGFLLGTEYERQKQKLQQERQQDYKQYTSQKNPLKQNTFLRQKAACLSLPIDDKISVRDKLREERNKEYNIFLLNEAQSKRTKKGTSVVTLPPLQTQDPSLRNAFPQKNTPSLSKRDAATLTEEPNNEKQVQPKNLCPQRRRRWQINRPEEPEEPRQPEEELYQDKDDKLKNSRLQDRHYEPENKEWRYPQSKEKSLQMPDSMKTGGSTPCISKDKDKAGLATGLMIGGSEKDTGAKGRKEKYRLELLEQIAENQRNRVRAKTLELKVDATGASDPEKENNNLQREASHKAGTDQETQRNPFNNKISVGDKYNQPTEDDSGNSPMDSRAALRTSPGSQPGALQNGPLLNHLGGNRSDLQQVLGETAVPGAAGLDPPVVHPYYTPVYVPNYHHYGTPVYAPFYHYGTRNPLSPILPYNQNTRFTATQQNVSAPHQSERPLDQSSSAAIETIHPIGASEQQRESVPSYQEALRLQLKDREEQKKLEREEKERYDAKIEAESKAYNPWGRSGGGAPIKDQQGNLVSDLKQMHRFNEESHWNSKSARAGTHIPFSSLPSGLTNEVSSEQFDKQNKYKKELKQQIEENKKKKTEERERMKKEDEDREKKIAEERARILHEYEEEQKKQMMKRHRFEKQHEVLRSETQQNEVREKMKQKKEREEVFPRNQEELSLGKQERNPSPPIPTLRKKHAKESRPSIRSSRAERIVSAPTDRPHSKGIPQLQCRRDLIRKLSGLHRCLMNEQKQLEVQLNQSQEIPDYINSIRSASGAGAFRSAPEEAARTSVYPHFPAVNNENIRQFNQIKYKDTESGEDVRARFPHPPIDDSTLHFRKKALLWKQQHRNRLRTKEEEHGYIEYDQISYYKRHPNGPSANRDTMLQSDPTLVGNQRSPSPSAGTSRGRPPQSSSTSDEWAPSSVDSDSSLNLQQYKKKRNYSRRTEQLPEKDVDDLSLRSALERCVSMETVATEAWLRPGTSDAAKLSVC